ncbi:MAG TPA: TraR/DksA C4-type zinc finger protein [Acidimicrobiales bacterium]|nr:TraR/DksA C4-type zinc finger protein [Acidimicrobiales bacterium]
MPRAKQEDKAQVAPSAPPAKERANGAAGKRPAEPPAKGAGAAKAASPKDATASTGAAPVARVAGATAKKASPAKAAASPKSTKQAKEAPAAKKAPAAKAVAGKGKAVQAKSPAPASGAAPHPGLSPAKAAAPAPKANVQAAHVASKEAGPKAPSRADADPGTVARTKMTSPAAGASPETAPTEAQHGHKAPPSHPKAASHPKAEVPAPTHARSHRAPAPALLQVAGAASHAGTVVAEEPEGPFLARQRELLLVERRNYTRQAEELRAEAEALALEHEPGDVQFDEEGGEGGTANVDRELDLHLSAQAHAAIEEIDAALAKLEAGTYGYCESCGNPIPRARLEALPHARLCVSCKSGGLTSRRQ